MSLETTARPRVLSVAMTPKAWSRLILVLALPALAGCTQTIDATTLGVPAALAEPAAAPPSGTPFSVSLHSPYLLWGLVTGGHGSVQNALAGQLADGSGLANVRIRTRATVVDVLITILTLGLVVRRTTTVEGVIVAR